MAAILADLEYICFNFSSIVLTIFQSKFIRFFCVLVFLPFCYFSNIFANSTAPCDQIFASSNFCEISITF